MEHLEEISVDELQRALEEVEGKKPTQRLLAAIAYKNGVSQTELARWYDVERKTIYNWLRRLDSGSLEDAVTDAPRPGRPRKLSDDRYGRLEAALEDRPVEHGYDASEWTPALVRAYVEDTFGVEYSLPSCRRLLNEAAGGE